MKKKKKSKPLLKKKKAKSFILNKLSARTYIIFAAVLAGIILIPLALITHQARNANAAVYYLNAIKSLNYPELRELRAKAANVAQNGWTKPNKTLVNILAANERCLKEARKARIFQKCDFGFGTKYKYLARKKMLPFIKLKSVHQLLLLKGRLHEKENRLGSALSSFISSLTLANHISRDDLFASKMIALSMERSTFKPLHDIVSSGKLRESKLREISDFLEKYDNNHFLPREIIESAKRLFLSNISRIADDIKKEHETAGAPGTELDEKTKSFTKEFIRTGNDLASRYYGNYLKALETGAAEDWTYAASESDALKNSMDPAAINDIQNIGASLYTSFLGNAEVYNKQFADRFLSELLATALTPNFRKAVDTHYTTMNKLRRLRVATQSRLRSSRRGK